MALKRLTIDGYGQVELNNCAFRRDGRIEAQCAPDTTFFGDNMIENGMLLCVDAVARKVTGPTNGLPIALNYSAEHLYDERKPGLKDFALKGDGSEDFLPRLGYLAVGDKYTTNCVSYDSAVDTDWTSDSVFLSAFSALDSSPLYATAGSDGSHLISATPPSTGLKLRVIEKTTMPNGKVGFKFQVYAC